MRSYLINGLCARNFGQFMFLLLGLIVIAICFCFGRYVSQTIFPFWFINTETTTHYEKHSAFDWAISNVVDLFFSLQLFVNRLIACSYIVNWFDSVILFRLFPFGNFAMRAAYYFLHIFVSYFPHAQRLCFFFLVQRLWIFLSLEHYLAYNLARAYIELAN